MTQSPAERYDDRVGGMLSCCDQVVITEAMPWFR
jgi:hypothetical protein